MRTIRIIEHISLDGVIQGPGGPEEDAESGFAHGGWSVPHHDEAVGKAIDAAQGSGFDLLLGRRTYDIFAHYWPHQSGAMADSLNAAREYVATHRPDSLAWGPAGQAVFLDDSDPRELELVKTETAASGVLMNIYRPAGPMKTGAFRPETP